MAFNSIRCLVVLACFALCQCWEQNWRQNWGNNWGQNFEQNWRQNWGDNWGQNWEQNWNRYWGPSWRQSWGENMGDNWEQNWEQNWGQNRYSRCYAVQRECMEMMRPAMYLNEYRYVYNGQLTVPCGEERQAAQACFERARQYQCDWDYNNMFGYTFMTWDFMCENSQDFIKGESCWGSEEFYNGMSQCNQGMMWSNQFDMCSYSRCMQSSDFPYSDSCSRENWDLFGQMGQGMWNTMSCSNNDMY